MPVNNFSLGKDVTLAIVTQFGVVTFALRTSFQSEPMYKEIKSEGADGVTRYMNVPQGWKITAEYDRQGPDLDDFFANQEAAYYQGVQIQSASITETIQEPDGSTSQYQYQQLSLKYDDAGRKMGNDKVVQKISGQASFRIKLA